MFGITTRESGKNDLTTIKAKGSALKYKIVFTTSSVAA